MAPRLRTAGDDPEVRIPIVRSHARESMADYRAANEAPRETAPASVKSWHRHIHVHADDRGIAKPAG